MDCLYLVLGDQLDPDSRIFERFDPSRDRLWMAESHAEITQVRHHQIQVAVFLSAMRHYCVEQRDAGRTVEYRSLSPDSPSSGDDLGHLLQRDLQRLKPQRVRVVRPGDRRVLRQLQRACQSQGLELELLEDGHFFSTPEQFQRHASERKQLRMEYFYREMRQQHGYLLDSRGQPEGGQWNFDQKNRKSFGRSGPPNDLRPPVRFPPDRITQEVCRLIRERYPDHPGNLDSFDLPVCTAHAQELLVDFLHHRLPRFGEFQDALWTGQHTLFHSHLSTVLNLKLLDPKQACDRAEAEYREGRAPLSSVEGFIRQLLGWREYVRGVYWTDSDAYRDSNRLEHHQPLPDFFWTGETEMRCLNETLTNVLENAYSHHIQRLMVTGLFSLLLGVRPQEFNDWHLATHRDAIDWVSTPNVIGMSQFADGGLLASKPYCASGSYIDRMSNYCRGCRYDPKAATGESACPFTTLYWDFLDRHRVRFRSNARLGFQLKNLDRKSDREMDEIRARAKELKKTAARFTTET